MSQAASFEILYAFDENMNDAFAALLTTGGLTVVKRGDSDDVATPYSVVDFVTGAARDHWKQMSDGSQRPDSWNAKLTIGIKTHRSTAAQVDIQKNWKAKLRKIFYDIKTNFVEANFPYYYVAQIMETGESPSLVTEDDHEICGVEWDIIFGIRTNAWPE